MARFTHLTLAQFRHYAHLELACDAPFVVLTGPNGSGKTNLLEALSMFSPGRGFRRAHPREQCGYGEAPSPWLIRAWLRGAGDVTHQLATAARVNARGEISGRDIRINGEPAPRQQALRDYLLILSLLPSMSHLLEEGMTQRRKFMDRIVYSFDAEHATRMHRFEHYMRERGRVLAMARPDSGWLDSLEQAMSEASVAMAATRLGALARLNAQMARLDPVFPQARLTVTGQAEARLQQGEDAAAAQATLQAMLRQSRAEERARGRCYTGAHKTRFEVTFVPREVPAHQCSTGEQKALLLSLLLAQIYAHAEGGRARPVILLDEMVAHLDAARRRALFEVLAQADIQVFATGTDIADFAALRHRDAHFVAVEAGALTPEPRYRAGV